MTLNSLVLISPKSINRFVLKLLPSNHSISLVYTDNLQRGIFGDIPISTFYLGP